MFARSLVGIAVLVSAGAAIAADPTTAQYHVVIFGGHQDSLKPYTGHTWATFTRTTTKPDGSLQVEPVTISWMPTDLLAHRHVLRATTGVNLSLEQTFNWFCGPRCKLSTFGPYEIQPCLYEGARVQVANLESGCVRYRVLDREPGIEHCIHAVTHTDANWEKTANPAITNGGLGTRRVAKALLETGLGKRPTCPPDWIFPALGLDKTCLNVQITP
jgi:hypothetical protein